jgi:hypothetical protein
MNILKNLREPILVRKRIFTKKMIHLYFDKFISLVHSNLRIKRIQIMNYKFYITNLYVNYFKSICQIIATKSIVKKKLNDAAELNEYNLKNKIFRKFKENTELQQIKNGVILRRKVLRRVFLNNIISLFVSVYKINY